MKHKDVEKTSAAVLHLTLTFVLICTSAGACCAQPAMGSAQGDPDSRALQALQKMTLDEKIGLIAGVGVGMPLGSAQQISYVGSGVGFAVGVPRLGIPTLAENDAGLGVANQGGVIRPNDFATALPSGPNMASTWDPELIERAGQMLGLEARSKGFNVQLAGADNLIREPRGGRTFEYMSEDPFLGGTLAGRLIRGVQSNNIVSTVKHFALNDQETGREGLSVNMSEEAMRESDLLSFELAIEIGNPGSVMCAYNRINSVYACENSFLLNDVLRRDWHYKGWVMSDWGAVHSVSIREGLDQESGQRSPANAYFGPKLREALKAGTVTEDDIDRSVLRILRTMYSLGLVDRLITAPQRIDFDADGKVAQDIAERGIVLLKNDKNMLPIAKSTYRILLVGGHSDIGVLGGAGSSQVNPAGGPALALPIPGQPIHRKRMYMPSSPLKSLRELLPDATITYDDGTDPARAAIAAHDVNMVLVFVEQFSQEGKDMPTLSLPNGQDKLVEAVATANPHTAVILETNGPVTMPWIDKVSAVLAAWYPGQRGGLAIARILAGAVNPSGRLPITFPKDIDQLPIPVLPGSITPADAAEKKSSAAGFDQNFDLTYPEGADAGYRWYDRTKAVPLFAFGHGLSYTQFAYHGLVVKGGSDISATFQISNVGAVAGAEVAQVYVPVNGVRHLVGWSRVDLAPGETRTVAVVADPRLLARFNVRVDHWQIAAGLYSVEVSAAVNEPRLIGKTHLKARTIEP
jgi:beta-glucosidase